MTKRVLLIDDDKDDAEIFEEALAEADSTAEFVYIDDGRLALQILQQKDLPLPSIIFLDVNMPIISGWECLKELKKYHFLTGIPVVMYSTSSHKKELDTALQEGAAAFSPSPTTSEN
jgi:CheY-like chemotaxis protein